MNELLNQLGQHGFSIPNIILDGKMRRFDRTGKKSAWFVGFENKTKKGDNFVVAVYGDWKTGERYDYKDEREYTKKQDTEISKQLRDAARQLEEERRSLQDSAKSEAKNLWDTGGENRKSEYLARKEIPELYGSRTSLGANGRTVLVPMCDVSGELWGIQTIHPSGQKLFLTGQRIDGCFHTIGGDLSVATEIYICEGFATGASIYQAIEKPVVVCFNAQNLPKVAKELKDAYPTVDFVICGDDDQFTTRQEDGEDVPYNPGRKYSEKAADTCVGSIIFPEFNSLESQPTDFNDLHILEGLGQLKEQLIGLEKTESKYILVLGFDDTSYYYTSSQNKHIKDITPAGHIKANLLGLMDLSYWASVYPNERAEDGVNWTVAIDDLMRKCRQKGPFSPSSVRGTGAWKGDDKELVVNLGNKLLTKDREVGFHGIKSKYTYEPGDRTLIKPSKDSLSLSESQEFLELLTMFRWANKDSYKFLAGWLMIAPVCGALDWRPHLWITGPSGSGKSTIMTEIVENILEGYAIFAQGQTTEAGLRQTLKNKAIPVVFDEFETHDEKSGVRIGQVVELFRQASSETNAQIVKGSAGGQAMSFMPRFAGIVSAINVNLPFEADKNRFTTLELMRAGGSEKDSHDHFKLMKGRFNMLSKDWVHKFYSHIFDRWDFFVHNKDLFMDEISSRYSARFGQQYSALLAGYSLLESDNKMTQEEVRFIVDTTDLEGKSYEQAESDELACLSHLMSKRVHVNGAIREDMTIFEIVERANSKSYILGQTERQKEYINVLKSFGMKVDYDSLYVASSHSEVANLFKGTKWISSYDKSLRRVVGSDNDDNKPHRFSGVTKKVVKIPLDNLKL